MKLFLAVTAAAMICLGGVPSWGQTPGDGTSFQGWRRGTAIVLFSGVGGGILGLSTLSFYGRPQEHTRNITTGALLGVLGGLTYVLTEGMQRERDSGFQVGFQPDGVLVGANWRF